VNNTNQISDGMELIVFGVSRQHFGKLKELYRLLSVALVTFPRRVEKPLQIQGYDLELLETQEVKPVRRGGTLAPKGGIRTCKVGERSAKRSSASLSHQVSVRTVAPTAI